MGTRWLKNLLAPCGQARSASCFTPKGRGRLRFCLRLERLETRLAPSASTVADAPLSLTLAPLNLVEGPNSNVVVASFTDADPAGTVSDYQATIQWGDGSSSAGPIVANSAGGFNVLGSHTYAEEGQNLPFSVQVQDQGGSSASQATKVTVADAPLTLTTASLNLVEGHYDNLVVASFTDADPAATAADFQAVIHWGDGFVSTASAAQGTIVPNGQGGFNVLGSHTYAEEAQNLPFSVQVQDLGRWDTPSREGNMATGGPTGGPYEQGRDIFTTQIYTAHISARVAQNGVYYPAVSGPVTSLTYSFDFCLFSGPSTVDQYAVGLMVKQGENYYVSDYTDIAQDGWNIGQTLTASHFYLISGSGPAAPDFSATGAPLEFGFLTAHTCLGLQTFVWGIANFKVTINDTTYQDSAFNDADWTHLTLCADNLGAATASQASTITVADAPLTL